MYCELLFTATSWHYRLNIVGRLYSIHDLYWLKQTNCVHKAYIGMQPLICARNVIVREYVNRVKGGY
jgi:hypothetical protein